MYAVYRMEETVKAAPVAVTSVPRRLLRMELRPVEEPVMDDGEAVSLLDD